MTFFNKNKNILNPQRKIKISKQKKSNSTGNFCLIAARVCEFRVADYYVV